MDDLGGIRICRSSSLGVGYGILEAYDHSVQVLMLK